MNRPLQSIILSGFAAAAGLSLAACSSSNSLQNHGFAEIGAAPVSLASVQPSFGVGDELGQMMFGQVAWSPEASPTHEVLVIAEAEPPAPSFDWVQGYLALK